MYKTMLPATGVVSIGVLGLSTSNSIVIGLSLIIVGLTTFKLVRFKIKDKK